jgi:hypothetical protein
MWLCLIKKLYKYIYVLNDFNIVIFYKLFMVYGDIKNVKGGGVHYAA